MKTDSSTTIRTNTTANETVVKKDDNSLEKKLSLKLAVLIFSPFSRQSLWGLGLAACVTGGVDNNDNCTPQHSYLHDGRARSIEEAVLWYGGEGDAAKTAYEVLPASQKQQLLDFLNSL